jgi:hypothetical protein
MVLASAGGRSAPFRPPMGTFMRRALSAALLLAALCAGSAPAWAQQSATSRQSGATAKQSGAKAKPSSAKKTVAAPKAQPSWRMTRSAGVPSLEFGGPATAERVIAFSCQPGSGLVRVVSHVGSRGVRPGDGAAIRLTNGKAKFEVAGTAFSAEAEENVDIGGTTKLDAKLFALFRAGDSMVLEVPGRKRTLPAASGRQAADALERACGQSSS